MTNSTTSNIKEMARNISAAYGIYDGNPMRRIEPSIPRAVANNEKNFNFVNVPIDARTIISKETIKIVNQNSEYSLIKQEINSPIQARIIET